MTTPPPGPTFPSVSASDLFRSFRHRNYRLYFSGQLVSLTGTWMQSTAQGWLVYRLTGSSMALGMVGFASLIPVLVLGLFGGVLADRLPKRNLLIAAQALAMLQAAALSWLTFSEQVQVWQVVAFAACLGVVNAVELPTRHSFVVEMVGKEDLHNAIALNSSIFHLARVLGPLAAGAVLGWVGEGACFAINAVSFLAVIAGLAAMRLEHSPPKPAPAGVREHLAQGLAFAWKTPLIRAILALISLVSLVGSSNLILLPVFAGDVFGRGPEGLGLLTAGSGVGSLLGALFMAGRGKAAGFGRLAFRGGLLMGAALVLFAYAPSIWLAAVCIVPTGFGFMALMASCNTMLQFCAPDDMRGRVMSLYTMLYMGMAPFGALLAGGLAQWLGAPMTVGILGVCCLAGALGPGRAVGRAACKAGPVKGLS
ncbi:MAG: MFS transporter [Acidobacteriota bacterium]